jgi:dimethylargininase
MIPRLAITHLSSPRLQECQRTFVPGEPIDGELAARQHASYCQALRDLGVAVRRLDANGDSPDGVFIEDTAVVLDEIAVLARMGASARQAEPSGIAPALGEYRDLVPLGKGTLEGGDVLRLGGTLLVGRSCRTSAEGIESLAGIVSRYGYQVIAIPIERCLHLKTSCTALPDGRLLINPDWISSDRLAEQRLHCMPAPEPWGANVLPVGETVLLPAAHARTAESLDQAGYQVTTVDISEFAKAEGGVTCLSLLVPG